MKLNINYCKTLGDSFSNDIDTSITTSSAASIDWDVLWDWNKGSSIYYYVSSPNYKIIEKDDLFEVHILAAGFSKGDIKASVEDEVLTVTTDKPGWNGNLLESIPLSTYNLDIKKTGEASLVNGILVVKFIKLNKFKKKSIKIN